MIRDGRAANAEDRSSEGVEQKDDGLLSGPSAENGRNGRKNDGASPTKLLMSSWDRSRLDIICPPPGDIQDLHYMNHPDD